MICSRMTGMSKGVRRSSSSSFSATKDDRLAVRVCGIDDRSVGI